MSDAAAEGGRSRCSQRRHGLDERLQDAAGLQFL